MPLPDEIIPLSRRLPAGEMWVTRAEPVPKIGYHAFIDFGGLILTVEAPCGCRMHYDTSELAVQSQTSNCLESCLREACDFEYRLAEDAALEALQNYSVQEDHEIGGEA
jgi:hypothetical protein